MKGLRVAVLMGGESSEREISLKTGERVVAALRDQGFLPTPIVIDNTRKFLEGAWRGALAAGIDASKETHPGTETPAGTAQIQRQDPADDGKFDVVFIAMHGRFGEDGTIQGLLDLVGVPYIGSGVLASALAMDKVMTRRVLRDARVRVPRDVVFTAAQISDDASACAKNAVEQLGLPLVTKPNREGSSVGVTIARHIEEVEQGLRTAASYDSVVLAEEYLSGTELTVGILGNDDPMPLPVIEIVPRSGFYDYRAKYTAGETEEIVPARVPSEVAKEATELALTTHRVVGCRGISRVDMKMHRGKVHVLEVNTIPGMTQISLVPLAARAAGIEFGELCERIMELAMEDANRAKPDASSPKELSAGHDSR